MRNIIKKCLAILLALLINIPVMPTVFAQEPEARIISIFRVDGYEARLARAVGGRTIEPRTGQRLSEGNILSTGWDTQVYIQMDQASILKMDESTRLQVAAARSLLSLTVQSGSALVEVAEQSPGNSIETRVGNTAIGVRGTMYIVSRGDTDIVTIIMLSGIGEVSLRGEDGIMVDILLPAGYVMWVYDVYEYAALEDDWAIIEQRYRIRGISGIGMDDYDVDEMDLFVLEEIINRQEYLIQAGIVTPEMIEAAAVRVEELWAEREALREAYIYAEGEEETVRVPLPVEVPRVTMPRTPQDDSTRYVNGRNQERDIVASVHEFVVVIPAISFVGMTTGRSYFIEFTLAGGSAEFGAGNELAFRGDLGADAAGFDTPGTRARGLGGTVINFTTSDNFFIGDENNNSADVLERSWTLAQLDSTTITSTELFG